jgi:hypothetical protein
MAAFEAPDPLSLGDVMVGGHLLQPGRSASIQHVDVFGVRLCLDRPRLMNTNFSCISLMFF